jgi:hypothetical protein
VAANKAAKRRWVVFHNNGDHPLDSFLKKGFKHCFCLIDDGTYIVMIDGLMGRPLIQVIAGSDYDIEEFYVKQGYTVVETTRGGPPNIPLILSNCVGLVKALIGINELTAFTPYQLYRRLTK